MGSSRTRARTHVPCIGRWIPNHCATREAPGCFFLKKYTSFFREVLGSQRNWVESTKSSHMPPVLTHSQTPFYQHSAPEWYICYSGWTYTDVIIITQSPQFTLGFTLGVVYSMGFEKHIMTCIHHYNIIHLYVYYSIVRYSFTALKILCSVYSSFPPH